MSLCLAFLPPPTLASHNFFYSSIHTLWFLFLILFFFVAYVVALLVGFVVVLSWERDRESHSELRWKPI